MESYKVELRAIKRVTHLWASLGYGNLIIEGDFANAIAQASGRRNPLWKLVNTVRNIRRLCRNGVIYFELVDRSTNSVADILTKVRVQKFQLAVDVFYSQLLQGAGV